MVISEGLTAEEFCAELASLLAPYRDQTDEWLDTREERFDELFATEEFGVFRVSPDGVIRDCNATAGAMLGYSRHEFVGMVVAALYAPTPNGRQKASGLFSRFTAGEGFCDEVMETQRKGGASAWMSLCVRVVEDSNGGVREAISTLCEAQPITD